MWVATFVLVLVAKYAEADFNATLSRDIFFPLTLASRAAYSQICLNNLLPGYEFDRAYVVPCGNNINNNSDVTCKVITAVNHADHVIAISFRGTSTTDQLTAENTTDTANFHGTTVQSYFYLAFSQLYINGLNARVNALHLLYPTYKFYVTGHSLGAALAALMAATLRINDNTLDVTFISYGMPRVGYQDYATLFNNVVVDPYRVTHRNDPVPHLPPMLLFPIYIHAHSEIWYNNNMENVTAYSQCNADDMAGSFSNANCSNTIEQSTINNINVTKADHDLYYNIGITDFAHANCTTNAVTTPSSPTSNPNASCPTGWNRSVVNPHNCYWLNTESNNWFASAELCQSYSASLVSIDNAFIDSELSALGRNQCDFYYIGLYNNNGTWSWINGDTTHYTNWENDYPNNVAQDLCGVFATSDGMWKNTDCGTKQCFICELNI